MAELPAPGESPNWIREALANAVAELRLFFSTARDFTLHPIRFGAAFTEGRQRAMNPLAFLATSAALLGGLRLLLKTATGAPDENLSLPVQAVDALAPYLHYAALGCVAHAVFRLTGSMRPLRDSLAMALFAGGGPAALAEVLTALTSAAFDLSRVPADKPSAVWQVLLIATPMLTFSVFSAGLASSLAASHRARQWWRTQLAILVSYTATGIVFGILVALDQQHGHYGIHWVITFGRTASGLPVPHIRLGM